MFKKIAIFLCAVLLCANVVMADQETNWNLPDNHQAQAGINFLGTGITIGPVSYDTYNFYDYHYAYSYPEYYYNYGYDYSQGQSTLDTTSFYWGGLKADVLAIQAIAQIQDKLPCGVTKMTQSFENNLLLKSNGITIKMSQEGYQMMKGGHQSYNYSVAR